MIVSDWLVHVASALGEPRKLVAGCPPEVSRHPLHPADNECQRTTYLQMVRWSQFAAGLLENARICRISSAFDKSLVARQLRHAGARLWMFPSGAGR
jgi:hypothetical protein